MPSPIKSLHNLKVLIVEDETLIAEEISERLRRAGMLIVDTVHSALAAINAVSHRQPDIILMDIRLKGAMDGIEAATVIRQRWHIPVMFLTAHSDHETLRRAKGSEPFGYILKPFQERDLLVAIEMALHRHSLEQRLKESEERYATTLASIGDAVIALDTTGRITFMNPAAESLTQWTLAEAKSLPIDDVLPMIDEATQQARENLVYEAMRERQVLQLTKPTLTLTRQREKIPIDDSAAPITDAQGKLLGAVVACRDIRPRRVTEEALKKAEEQLRQAQRMEAIGRLAGGIAHDFNNLLTVINGFTELLMREQHALSEHEILGEIKKAGDRASILTKQLLAFSRRQTLQSKVVHLDQLVQNVSSLLQRLIGEDIALCPLVAPDVWPIQADPSQLEQVIVNLAVNARDAMPQGGVLTIDIQNADVTADMVPYRPEMHVGRYVMVAVTDNGMGMDQSTQDRIFEPFFTTKEEGKGTGLGLATVYGIVKQSGGFIFLYSEVGRGTTFKLYFPIAAHQDAVIPACSCDILYNTGGTETILLVEDDVAVRSLTATALHHQGYTVYEANNGQEALVLFATHGSSIHLVVTDVIMPLMSGRELSDKIRALNPAARILFLSGYTDEALVRQGILQGEWSVLQKPFTLAALAQQVRWVLDQ
jgi:two-component system cell cycle sensor histidine kinase/response regulator CckA